jgi:phage terminase large subunit GpA-like protein
MSRRRNAPPEDSSYPDWLRESLRVLCPPENITVTEFTRRHKLLDRENGSPFNDALTPYLIGVMDAFTDPDIEEIWYGKPTQVGGTRAILNMLAYIIAQDPDDAMVVYPTDDLAEYASKNRIQPMIENSPVLRDLYLPGESTDLELHFSNGMILVLAGANSPAPLASRPIRYLFLDEVDKYPLRAGKEASPIELAIERTKTFPHNRKIVGTSTPTFKTGNIWKRMEGADQLYEYAAYCPHCGHQMFWAMRNKDRKLLRWPEGANPEEARESAWYECEKCQGRITDSLKTRMVREGKWVLTRRNTHGKMVTAFRMNTFPSPWVRLGDIARKFLKSKDDPVELQNFINSWLAEIFEQKIVRTSADLVLERRTRFEEGEVPDWAILLTGGVDVQKDHMYWVIRAWGPMITSQCISYGIALSWADIETVMNRPWHKAGEGDLLVSLCGIDSGDGNTQDDVYEFCALNADWAIPTKGSSNPLITRYRISKVDKVGSSAYGMQLVLFDGGQYKSMIASRMNRTNGKGSWMVHAGCDRAYAEQVTAEHIIKEKRNGQEIERWVPNTSHAANHYLDAEVIAAVAADLKQVRYLAEGQGAIPIPEPPPQPIGNNAPNSNWLQPRENWL